MRQCALGENVLSVGKGCSTLGCSTIAMLCNMAIVGRNERSRNSRELCRYGNNSKERDAEMERDMYCLQRWTNIFVGKHTSSLDGVFFFFNECLCETFFSKTNVRCFSADTCVTC